MKHLLTSLLLLIGLTSLAQPAYLDLFIQFDNYPQETSWIVEAVSPSQDTSLVAQSPSYNAPEFQNGIANERLLLQANTEYIFTIFDDFGDGICCGFGEGFFNAGNDCQGLIFEDSLFNSPQVSYNFILEPCALPSFDVTFRLDLNDAPEEIINPEVNGEFNGWCGSCNAMQDENNDGIWETTIALPEGTYLWKFSANNWQFQELPIGVNESPCFSFDENGFANRVITVGTEDIILPPYCWESCLPCGAIPGCTNSDAINWNPWANFDTGQCDLPPTADCNPNETYIEIRTTPDNFGGETSWKLFGDDGLIAEATVGTYAGATPGLPISTLICVPIGGLYDIVVEDTYGDGLCGTCFGGNVNGNVELLDCENNILYNLQDEFLDGNFGYLTTSPQVLPTICADITEIFGCTDPNYLEYNPYAIIDFGDFCLTPIVLGCLDEEQFNYNPEANVEDEILVCDFTLTITDGVGDGWFGSWLGIYQEGWLSPQYKMGPNDGTELTFNLPLNSIEGAQIYFFTTPQSINTIEQCGFTLTNPEGEIIIDVPQFFVTSFPYLYEIEPYCGNTCEPYVYGCLDPMAVNFTDGANTENESCYYAPGCTSAGYLEYYTQGFEADFDNGNCQTLAVFGCTDQDAFNFNEEANVDNETCVDKIFGCTNDLAFNYDPLANTDDNSCVPIIEGCTNPEALNYVPEANTEDFSCILPILGCTDVEAFNFNLLANTDDGTCIEVVFGCTDSTAFNYNPLANTNVGCESVVEGCTDEEAINYNPQANTDNGTCEAEIFGCTDPTAFNYDELANTDNGSCEEVIFGCLDEIALNYNPDANTDNGSCVEEIEGCMDPLALNYNELANVEDGSCIDAIYGCTDSDAFNYNELANADNGTCIDVVEGCTDPTAFNFNPEANTEDFSCEPFVYGCTDPQAANYDEEANTDNGTCETVYANCIDPVVETYNLLDLGSECFAWVIDVSPSCCNSEWADGCQTLYNYCDENTVTNVEEFGETQITVFPNPTRNIITVATSLNVNATLYNAVGQPVYQNNNVQQIDLSKYEAGIYNLILTYNDLQFTKKIVKQ